MRRNIIVLLGLLIVTLATTVALAASDPLANAYAIPWWTVDGGGAPSQGGSYELSGTIGQADASTSSGGSYTVVGGFWSVTLRNSRIYLPLILK